MVNQIFSHVSLHIFRHFLFTQGIQGFQGCRVPARSSRLRPSRWGKWIRTGPLFREPSEVLTGMLCFSVRNLVCLCFLFEYYMVIDLKVLVKSFNCEDRSCYAWNPRVFCFLRYFLFAKVSRKLDIMNHITASQMPWSWSTSLHLPLVLPDIAFWSLKKQAPNAAAKLPKVRLAHQGPWCLLFLWRAPCWWLSADRGIFAKVPRKFSEGVCESQSAVWRKWPSKPCKKNCLIGNNLSWEGDSVMLAACLQGYEEVVRDNLVWFGRWWMHLHKRSCSQHGFRER